MKRAAPYIILTLILAAVVYAWYRYGFLRKPDRNTPYDDSLFISPANGTIIAIRPYGQSTFIETKDAPECDRGAMQILTGDVAGSGTVITIRLDLDDVHYQRAPTSGVVVHSRYTSGKHEPIYATGEAEPRHQNEHNEILFTDTHGNNYKVVQIAGFIARSIKAMVTPGQWVEQGQIIGCIEIGSQVTIILPPEINVTATVGDYVIDGETVLGAIL